MPEDNRDELYALMVVGAVVLAGIVLAFLMAWGAKHV